MFILHSSNKTENLVEHLAAVLRHAPLSSPFSPEYFLIQSLGMERWLFQQLASRFPVWANYRFLFPERFFSLTANRLGIATEPGAFDRHCLLWRIEALLRKLDGEDFAPVRTYLAGNNPAMKRFQLAGQIAQLFDQYQIMRPDLLASWQQGELWYRTADERWQKALWLSLTAEIGTSHRGQQWLDVIDRLNQAPENSLANSVPERLCLFGINTMPPLLLNYLQSLSRHCQIHLFLLNPSKTYWADIGNKHRHSGGVESPPHPLLVSLGQQGREFHEMLLDHARFDMEPESFTAEDNPSNLQQLQNDILHNTPGQPALNDGSIQIHACHSRKREVEVLKDLLLKALCNNPSLELRDIVVMAPDIQAYEPFIPAIFHDLPHSVADRSFRLNNRVLDAFIRFLSVSQTRLGWQSVLDVLTLDAVYPSFDLSSADLDLIRHWIEETGVRWGESAAHKAELGLPAFAENTWQASLERLLMGYAVSDDSRFSMDILPYPGIEGSSAAALGGLHDFLRLLFDARNAFKQARSLKAWSALLRDVAAALLRSAAPLELQPLNELLLELDSPLGDSHQEAVEMSVILQWLEGNLSESLSSQGFLRGQLTFCSMLPMRSIPFKVIAVMGLNEGEFPKADRAPVFDLISHDFRKGDRSRRRDDRYQFLEILLSTREQLLLTYTGQSQHSNETIPPSAFISELLGVLVDSYGLDGLITPHPLQAFSPRYFDGTPGLFSFSREHCETAQALLAEKTESPIWWQGALAIPQEAFIDLDDLFAFFRHPQRYFLRRHFGIRCQSIEADTEEREAFAVNQLHDFNLNRDWLAALLNGQELPSEILCAQGRWLPGVTGELAYAEYRQQLLVFCENIKALAVGDTITSTPLDIKISRFRLCGRLAHGHARGNLLYRYANLKGSDFIPAWLYHLASNQHSAKSTHLVSADFLLTFDQAFCPENALLEWLEIYTEGKKRPDAFFTEAAFAYLAQTHSNTSGNGRTPPYKAALNALRNVLDAPYENEISQLFGNSAIIENLLPETHSSLWDKLLLPAWEHAHGG